jgi:hypothetical protein
VWKALGLDSNVGVVPVTWSDAGPVPLVNWKGRYIYTWWSGKIIEVMSDALVEKGATIPVPEALLYRKSNRY